MCILHAVTLSISAPDALRGKFIACPLQLQLAFPFGHSWTQDWAKRTVDSVNRGGYQHSGADVLGAVVVCTTHIKRHAENHLWRLPWLQGVFLPKHVEHWQRYRKSEADAADLLRCYIGQPVPPRPKVWLR